jgi:hypothetical protein
MFPWAPFAQKPKTPREVMLDRLQAVYVHKMQDIRCKHMQFFKGRVLFHSVGFVTNNPYVTLYVPKCGIDSVQGRRIWGCVVTSRNEYNPKQWAERRHYYIFNGYIENNSAFSGSVFSCVEHVSNGVIFAGLTFACGFFFRVFCVFASASRSFSIQILKTPFLMVTFHFYAPALRAVFAFWRASFPHLSTFCGVALCSRG